MIQMHSWILLGFGTGTLLFALFRCGQRLHSLGLKSARQAALSHLPFALLAVVYFLVRFSYRDVRPIWDGGNYWLQYLQIHRQPFDLSTFNISGLTTQAAVALYSLSYPLTRQSIIGFNLWMAVLGTLGLVIFYRLVQELFREWIRPIEAALLTACFAFHPTVLGPSLNFSFDWALTFFFLSYWLALLKRRPWMATAAGICLVFSKDAGIILLPWPWLHVLMFRREFRSERRWRIRYATVLALPAGLLCLYGIYLSRIRHMDWFSWEPARRVWEHWLLIYGLNFNWVATGVILAGILYWDWRSSPARNLLRRPLTGVGLVMLACSWALTQVTSWSHPRSYMLLSPLLILGIGAATQEFALRKCARLTIFGLFGCLWAVQCWGSVDPVSNRLFGTIPFGSRRLISIASWTGEGPGGGRDQLIYNLEWTYLPRIVDRFLAVVKPDNQTCMTYDALAPVLFPRLNRETWKPDDNPETSFEPLYRSLPEVVQSPARPRLLYCIHLPAFEEPQLEEVARRYTRREELTWDFHGYQLRVTKLSGPIAPVVAPRRRV